MLARYIKMQLLVLLCGGLVGPIFLVVYFTLGLGSLMSWMFYVGLIITVADVLVALALTNYGQRPLPRPRHLNGVECWRSPKSPGSARQGPGSTINRW